MLGSGSKRRCLAVVVLALALGAPVLARAESGGRVFLPVTQQGFTPDPGPTSLTLIERAEEAHTISHETALTYEVFALFGDSRLPTQYRGAPAEDSQVMAHLRAEWSALSANARAALAPFLLPPNAPGSWMNLSTIRAQSGDNVGAQAVEWRSVTGTSGVKVWYQTRFAGDDVKARGLADAVDSRIAAALITAMGQAWLPDGGLANNGGDPLLDLYLVQGAGITYRGLTTPYTGCEQTPAWINLNSARPLGDDATPGIVQSATHEMMHSIQFALPLADACSSYDWLAEATAKWSEDYVYHNAQSEQPYAPSYLDTAYWPLENTTNQRWYGAYVYPFFLTNRGGSPYTIGLIWQNAGGESSLKAVDDSGATFEDNWKDFAVHNWNRGPDEAKEYQEWDSLTHAAHPFAADKTFSGVTGVTKYAMPTRLEHLSIQYQHIYFTDESARSVIFYNGLDYNLKEGTPEYFDDDSTVLYTEDIEDESEKDSITVQALLKIEGDDEWQVEDWTYLPEAGFCRDSKDGRIEELVLIFANSEYDDANPDYTFNPKGLQPTLLVSDVGCYRWEGTVTATYVGASDRVETKSTSNVVFERTGGLDRWVREQQQYTLTTGTLSWSYVLHTARGTDYDCVWTLPSTPVNVGDDWGLLETFNGLTGGAHYYSYTGNGVADDTLTYTITGNHCGSPGDPPQTTQVDDWFHTDLETTGAPLAKFTSGGVMDASYTDDSGEFRYTWHLEAKREG
jgi:hypothetical protein